MLVLSLFSARERAEFSLCSSRFLSFSRQRSNMRVKKAGEQRSTLGVSKKLGRGGGMSDKVKGKGWGEKESPPMNPKQSTELRSPTNGKQQCNLIGY